MDLKMKVDHLDHNLAGKLIAYLLIEREVRRVPDLVDDGSIHKVMVDTLMVHSVIKVD